jgi:hypothetical protein
MALLGGYLAEEERKRQGQQAGSSGGFQLASGIQGGAAGSDKNTVNTNAGAMTKKTTGNVRGSGFTNLDKYIQANKGEGDRMGGDVSGMVGQQATDKTSEIAKNQTETIENLRNTNKGSDFDSNLLSNATKLTDDQKKQFSQAYNQDFNEKDWAAGGAGYNKVADRFQLAEGDARLNPLQMNVDLAGNESGLKTLTQQKYKDASKNAYSGGMGGLDAFLLGQSTGAKNIQDTASKGVESFKGQFTSGQENLGKTVGEVNKLVDDKRAAVQAGYGKALGLADSNLSAAQKFDAPKYEDYKGATEFALFDDAGIQAAKANVDAINQRNRAAYDKSKADYTKRGTETLAQRNALAALTKKAASNVDFDKLFGGYTGNRDIALTTKAPEFTPGTSGSDPLTEYTKETGDRVSEGLKEIKPKVIDATNPNPVKSVPAIADIASTVATTGNRIDPIQQAAGGYFKMNKFGIPEWVSTGGGGGGSSSSGGGGGGSSSRRQTPSALK